MMGRLFRFTVASLTRMRRASRLAVVPVLALMRGHFKGDFTTSLSATPSRPSRIAVDS
jgi:hypothetical protein